MGQLGEILQHAPRVLKDTSEEGRQRYYELRDAARSVLDGIKCQVWQLDHPGSYYGITAFEIGDRFRTAVDLRQVVRHHLAHEHKPEGDWTTDFDPPFPWSKVPLATMRRNDESPR